MNKINCGIIGFGVGERHAKFYNKSKFTVLKKVYEKNKSYVKQLKKRYPSINFVKNENEIINDNSIKLVSIASYDNYHCNQIIKCLKKNKDIFVEKPLCLNINELKRIIKVYKKSNSRISCNLNLRGSPQFKKIKSIHDKKKLGKTYYIEADYNYGRLHKITDGWRNKIPFYSVTYGGAVHMIDQIIWLLKDFPCEVKAEANKIVTKKSKFRFNDFSLAMLRFKSGIIGKVSSNFSCNMPHHHSLKIFGTKGTLDFGIRGLHFYNSRNKNKRPKILKFNFSEKQKNNVLKNFAMSIYRKKNYNSINFKEILNCMLVCFAIEKSFKSNKNIKINYKNYSIK